MCGAFIRNRTLALNGIGLASACSAMRNDWAIRADVCERLVKKNGFAHVLVSVRRGEVHLSGHVANRRVHKAALRIASGVEGVQAVYDELDEDRESDFAEEAGPKQTEFGDERSTRAIMSNDFDKLPP
jgi:osmotically-inducible protein OsmY